MEEFDFKPGPAFAGRLDKDDELGPFRKAFLFAEPDLIYLDGNSLGRLTLRAAAHIHEAVEGQWGRELIRGWNQGWYQAPGRVGDKIAPLVGSGPDQIVVSDSTSVNLFKLATAALSIQTGRQRIISDDMNFPSDLYVLQGCIHLLGNLHQLELAASADGIHGDQKALLQAIDEQTALVSLSHVAFKSGYLYDVQAITERAHQAGALVLWDVSHSVGAVPITLDEWGVDLAVGCSYKYLNGGPGAPAFLYVRRGLQDKLLSPIWGWFGEHDPFSFGLDYRPAEGIARFLVGTPPILSLLALEASLDPLLEAGIERIRRKSVLLTSYLVYLIDSVLNPLGFSLGSPRDPNKRGSHVSIRHPEAYRINRALIEEMGVLPDFREPDNIRLGVSPLYTSFEEVWQAVERLGQVVQKKHYLRYSSDERLPVT